MASLDDVEFDETGKHSRCLGRADLGELDRHRKVEFSGGLGEHGEYLALHPRSHGLDGVNEVHAWAVPVAHRNEPNAPIWLCVGSFAGWTHRWHRTSDGRWCGCVGCFGTAPVQQRCNSADPEAWMRWISLLCCTCLDMESWADLSQAEARAILDEYVDGYDERVERPIASYAKGWRGRRRDLDFSRESLETVWPWFVKPHRLPTQPVGDEMFDEELPVWCRFDREDAKALGPELCRETSDLAAYVAGVFIGALPDSTWEVGSSQDVIPKNQPVLAPTGRVPFPVDRLMVNKTRRALHGDRHRPRDRAPDSLMTFYDLRMGLAPKIVEPDHDFEVQVDEEVPGFTHFVSVSDEIAHSDRLDAVVAEAASEVERIHREDREVLLVGAPGWSPQEVESLLNRLWESNSN